MLPCPIQACESARYTVLVIVEGDMKNTHDLIVSCDPGILEDLHACGREELRVSLGRFLILMLLPLPLPPLSKLGREMRDGGAAGWSGLPRCRVDP